MTTKEALIEQEKARQVLFELFADQERPTVYTILRHVGASGMSRNISLFTIMNGEKVNLTYSTAEALGLKVRNSGGFNTIRVSGAGMDMGFHLVYNLSGSLYGFDANQPKNAYTLKQEWA